MSFLCKWFAKIFSISLTYVTSSINDFKQFRTAWFHYYIILIHSQAVRCSTTEDHLSSKVRMIDIWWSVFWRDKLLNFFRNKSDWQNTKPMIDNRHLNSFFNRTWDDILMAASFMFTHQHARCDFWQFRIKSCADFKAANQFVWSHVSCLLSLRSSNNQTTHTIINAKYRR